MEEGELEGSSIKGKRVIVTGGAGVIGRELLKLLIEKGVSIVSVDRYPLPKGDWSGVSHVQKDLATDSLDELRDFQPQIIFHLAAAFEKSKESPEFWNTNWHDNIVLSHRIAGLTKELPNLEVFLLASSYLVYSPSLYLSPSLPDDVVYLKEDDFIAPRNLCGAAKYYTEGEIEFVKGGLNPSLRTVYARIFRVYGCGSRDVISRWARAALFGQGIEVYNKQNRFDFVFARDVAEGLLRLAQSHDAEGPVNLGSGVTRSIQDILNLLVECVPMAQSRIQELGTREPFEASCADLTRLRRLTGWVPSTELEEGIKIIIDFEHGIAGQEIAYE
jgi:carbamoyl-phosphate synthase large subunit